MYIIGIKEYQTMVSKSKLVSKNNHRTMFLNRLKYTQTIIGFNMFIKVLCILDCVGSNQVY